MAPAKAIVSNRRRNLYLLEPGEDEARATIMSMLIDRGQDPHVVDSDGNTLLHHACIMRWATMCRLLCETLHPDCILGVRR